MNLAVALSLLLSVPAADADQPTAEQLRAAVQRSVPYLESRGQEWIEERNCVSCHQVPYMLWSLRSAQEHGLKLDEAKLRETFDWAADIKHFAADVDDVKFDEKDTAGRNVDTLYTLLLARGDSPNAEIPAWANSFESYLVGLQQKDGSWKPCGQLPGQRRPVPETTVVATIWALLALDKSAPRDELKKKVEAARNLFDKAKPGQSAEWWAVRLMFERRFGDAQQADALLAQLKKLQHEDGGWGWLVSEDSDALATGIVLYALRHEQDVGPVVGRAQKFLLATQQKNGSWRVPSTLQRFNGAEKPTSTYLGTAWAAIGILNTLP